MIDSIVRNWWVFALRGVLAIAFGVLAFVRPDITLVALIALFGTYALLDGITSCIVAPMLAGSRYFWWVLLDGILGIAVGVLTFMHPGVAAATLLLLLGAWLIVGGIFRIVAAIELRKQIDDEWFYILSGVLSVAAGVLTVSRPNQTVVAWLWVMGTYVILYGLIVLTLAFKLWKLGTETNSKKPVAQG